MYDSESHEFFKVPEMWFPTFFSVTRIYPDWRLDVFRLNVSLIMLPFEVNFDITII